MFGTELLKYICIFNNNSWNYLNVLWMTGYSPSQYNTSSPWLETAFEPPPCYFATFPCQKEIFLIKSKI